MRIAVIGAGLAGLTAAWLLGRQHQVTLHERQPRPGFTAANVAVPGPGGSLARVDVPLRVFYPGYYPTLARLYQALGVASEPVSYAASFHGPALAAAGEGQGLYFRYRNLRWGARSVAMLAPADWRLGPAVWPIARGALRFRHAARAATAGGTLAGRTIGDWVAGQGLPAEFIDGLLLPAIATVCTCTLAQAAAVPAEVVAEYLGRGLARQSVHRVLHGADEVQRRLLAGIADLRCDARIVAVRRLPDGCGAAGALQPQMGAAEATGAAGAGAGAVQLQMDDGRTETVDHLVLATQAGVALQLLGDGADADERAALAGLPDVPVQVLTHGDARLMPARRGDWSPVNLWTDRAAGLVESTIWLNAVQPALRGAPDVFQTVHPLRAVDPARVLGEARFRRPVVDLASQPALARLQALMQQPAAGPGRPGRRVWFCGSQADAGVPLLESAVRSAFAVARRLGVDPGDRPGARLAAPFDPAG